VPQTEKSYELCVLTYGS